jgi:hypothetical protein
VEILATDAAERRSLAPAPMQQRPTHQPRYGG